MKVQTEETMKSMKLKLIVCGVCTVLAWMATTLHAQTLPITNGLQLWLKADYGVSTNSAGLVTNWLDASGNDNNAAPTNSDTSYSPTFVADSQNGLPTLRFPGGSKALDVPDISVSSTSTISGLTNDVTIIVVKEDDSYAGYRAGVSKTLGNAPGPFDFYNNAGVDAGETIFYLKDGNTGGNNSFIGNSFKPQPGVYQVMSFTYANGSVTHYLNDAVNASFNAGMQPDGSPGSAWSSVNGPGPLRIGSREDFVTQLVGNMAEILIYQPALTTSQLMEVVTNYLQPKWNLQFDPPPVVSINLPTNGASFALGTLIPVNISASSPTGIVTSVSVYGNGYLIGSSMTPPYNLEVGSLTPGSMTFTAVALDQLGRPATSPPVSITITGPVAPTSPPSNGLALWLNAGSGVDTNSDGTVASWADESGNGNNASPTNNAPYDSSATANPGTIFATVSPQYVTNVVNGYPVVHFNGTNSILTVPDAGTSFLTGDFSTFVVARFSQAWFGDSQMVWSKASNNLACPFDWTFTTAGQMTVFRGNGVGYGAIQSVGSLPLNQFVNVGAAFQGNTATIYSGASPYYSGTITTPPGDGTGSLPLTIGMRDDGAVALYGDIAEILIYNSAQSGTNLTNIAAYLNGKYSLAQPYYANPAPVVSISSPVNGSVLTAPTTATFAVSASSPLDIVTNVSFYANGVLLASVTNSPYSLQLNMLTPGTVNFTAVATDNWGIQSTSPPTVVSLTGTGSAPPVTNGLGIWLKPDAGIVTNLAGNVIEWDDQSGNTNNAYQPSSDGNDGSPAFGIPPQLIPDAQNGYPVVRFTPPTNEATSNVFLDIADNQSVTPSVSTGFAIFAVTRIPAYNSYYELISDCNPNGPGYANPFEYRINSGTGEDEYILGSGTTDPVSSTANVAGPASSNFFNIEGIVVANGVITHYLDFKTNGSTPFSYTPADSGFPIRVGGRSANSTGNVYTFNGDIAELQVFTNGLSTAQVGDVVNYFSYKYQLPQVQIAAVPPVITVTALTNAVTPSITNVTAPGLLNIGAQITSASPISSVSFIVNGQVVATESSPPYQMPLDVLTPGALSIVVQATDIYGISSNSPPLDITVPGTLGALPSAPPTNGLVLWLKADAGISTNSNGAVTNWADQSGNTNDASTDQNGAAAPSLLIDTNLGKPVVTFNPNGSPMCLDVADAPSVELVSDMSLFYAVEFTNFADTTLPQTIVAKTFGNEPYPFDYDVTVADAELLRGNANGNDGIISSGPLPAGQYFIGGATVLSSVVTHYLNYVTYGSGTLGYGTEDGGTSLKVGSRDDFETQLAGNLGEVLLYNRALTGNDLQLANTYLAGRYGIATFQLEAQPPLLGVSSTGLGTVQIAWPAAYIGWVLESSTNLVNWSAVATNPPNSQITIGLTGQATFYRLQSQ